MTHDGGIEFSVSNHEAINSDIPNRTSIYHNAENSCIREDYRARLSGQMRSERLSVSEPCRLRVLILIVFVLLKHSVVAFRSTSPVSIDHRLHASPNHDTSLDDSVALGRDRLQHYFHFPLDNWQLQAGGEILKGHNVIVCAPTGAGKTVVGEMALHIAVENDANAIYTTPLKALSNQKFTELREIFDKRTVGLSTGDMSVNRRAQLTVMTTEVYRNIAWRSSGSPSQTDDGTPIFPLEGELLNRDELNNNKVVVLDEFHYMGQPGRGGVWEESVITSPSHTQIVALSATLSNAEQLASWMEGVTGRATVLVEATDGRPVPLRFLFATREGIYPLFRNPDAGPGAPQGLLGLRGDGVVPGSKSRPTNGGFGGKESEDDVEERLANRVPRGLRINPALKNAADRRMQRINRAIDRQKARATFRREEDDWDPLERSHSGGRQKGQMNSRNERRERERLLRSEMRKAVPSLPILLRRLQKKELLPAIFFIFSRAGCDEAAENVCRFMRGPRDALDDESDSSKRQNDTNSDGRPRRKRNTRQRGGREPTDDPLIEDGEGRSFRRASNYVSDDVLASIFEDHFTKREIGSHEAGSPLAEENWIFYTNAGLLSRSEVEQVANRIASFNEDNNEIAFSDARVECFLFGVGSHHAGMLAAHKAFAERLFRAQLMKVVFATETLAAGINMPARSTIICSLAKRGDGNSMKLLETSNLLQMSGRAGRRGMDTDGTCVIVATPFEGPDDAASILIDEIKPIMSQFSPSYTLAVNLVARGEGKLNVARQLVQKSFAMWEKRQLEESIASTVDEHGDPVSEVIEVASKERFMRCLMGIFKGLIGKRSAKIDISRLESFLGLLSNREELKKTSKSYVALSRLLDLERTTLEYLEREKATMVSMTIDVEDELLADLLSDDRAAIDDQVELQRKRFIKTEREILKHPFTAIVGCANQIMEETTPEARGLKNTLRAIRATGHESVLDLDAQFSGDELSVFSKSVVVMKRKARKLRSAKPELDSHSLLEQTDRADAVREDTWQDMLAITRVLVCYGCLSTNAALEADESEIDGSSYHLTPAGVNIGMIGLENSLWGLVAFGGAWDVEGVSSRIDDLRSAFDSFDETEISKYSGWNESLGAKKVLPNSQIEAERLLEQIRLLSPGELAGYASCLVSEGGRGSPSVIESFQRLTPQQQQVVQSALLVLERLMEVQKEFSVDEISRRCTLELSNCEVVTAWAQGCSWSEALEISGSAPGDLVRTLGRAMDVLRQFANLPFIPIRATDFDSTTAKNVSPGIHPEVRRLCRDAARAINRYPVKDPLPFDTEEDEIEDELESDIPAELEDSAIEE